ncbi:MAG TPA: tetratricopeptide repeat protein [Bryobacteraceae bacterium]|jgi:tetratricopeptide (TPR) repeat protein/tRNA A-37 threonylcarbamoyl transferase component Bud32|nr:tetratricopeptide repeat protein [Bryobacteraceae bacterium]
MAPGSNPPPNSDDGRGGELWSRTESLFLAALEIPENARARFLDGACGGDARLRAEVESLLAFDHGEEDLQAKFHTAAASIVDNDLIVGQRAGAYQIIDELGRGGMGTVYRAIRADDEYRKQVAIKLVNRGMDTDATLERFRQERQILANLDHPYIARLLDGGSIGGQPFFVMELVEGKPIDRYCREQDLPPEAICRLFLRVCEGVEHAHHNLIVHRDLKPGNILVTDAGIPKLLDFGVAKLLTSESHAATTLTHFAQRQMTPAYASPEQFRGLPATVSTDVYALAAILYELLTGVRAHQLSPDRPDHWERIICSDQVARPRTANRKLPRDLETIVLMGLRKEADRRYPSVEQFAADIRRYLERRPVEARTDTVPYRAARFIRRNWLAVLAGGAVFVALSGGIVVSALEVRRANRAQGALRAESQRTRAERDRAVQAEQEAEQERNRAVAERERANTEAGSAKAIVEFLRDDLLEQANPVRQSGTDMTVRAALDRAAERIQGKFADRPLVEAAIRTTMGESYFALSRFTEAQQQFQHATDLFRTHNGPRHRTTLSSMTSVAAALRAQGKLAEAERIYTAVLEVQLPTLTVRDPETLTTMGNLAVVYANQQKYSQAEALNLQVLATQRSLMGPEHLDTLRTMNNLGVNYTRQGKYDQAEDIYRRILEVRRRTQGPEHPTTLFTMTNLGAVYVAKKSNPDEAERLFLDALQGQRKILGSENRDTMLTLNNLGTLWLSEGRAVEAEKVLAESLDLRLRVLGDRHPDTLTSMTALGESLFRQSRFAEAEVRLRQAVNGFEKSGSDTWIRRMALVFLGASLSGQKRYQEAEPLILAGREGLVEKQATISASSRYLIDQSAAWIADLYQDWGKTELAAEWRQRSIGH